MRKTQRTTEAVAHSVEKAELTEDAKRMYMINQVIDQLWTLDWSDKLRLFRAVAGYVGDEAIRDFLETEDRDRVVRRHIVISGTGRTGTSFLVQLLTHLGLDTGYGGPGALQLVPAARAGLERDIRDENAPYIVKSPWLCDYIDKVMANPSIRIERAIIPVRCFEAAAASRAHVQQLTTGHSDGADLVPGGLWHTDKASEQISVLRLKFIKLVEELVRHDVPITFLWYPRLVQDPDYLYDKLSFLIPERDSASFRRVFEQVVRVDWVHQFSTDDR
jgi:hypothetical protein